jgi:hypothetical protein
LKGFDSNKVAPAAMRAPAPVKKKRVARAIYYFGRAGQIIGMWILLVDIFTAGPFGPDPRLFAAGVATFLAGWGLTRAVRRQ